MSITIYRNPNGDTRTAPNNVSFKEFQQANDMHIKDVRNVMNYLATLLMMRGSDHDWTKKSEEKLFYDNFVSAKNYGTDFVNNEWYQLHINEERHHLLLRCPQDVNLIDVLEMIVDCVCAGKTRGGEIRNLEIDDNILKKALNNTVKQINDITILKD